MSRARYIGYLMSAHVMHNCMKPDKIVELSSNVVTIYCDMDDIIFIHNLSVGIYTSRSSL